MVESVVKILVVDVSVIVEDSDEVEDAKDVVDSVVEILVGKVSVTVLESGSVDEIEEVGSVEVLKEDVSIVDSVVKSVEVEGVSDE